MESRDDLCILFKQDSTCSIDGVCYDPDDLKAGTDCFLCDPLTNKDTWSISPGEWSCSFCSFNTTEIFALTTICFVDCFTGLLMKY